jgi:hypothetical protein
MSLKENVSKWVDKVRDLRKKFDKADDEHQFKKEIEELHKEHDELKKQTKEGIDWSIVGDLKLYNGDLDAMSDYIEKKSSIQNTVKGVFKKAKLNIVL